MISVCAVGFLAEKPVLNLVREHLRVCEFTVLSTRRKKRDGELVTVWERAIFVAWGDEAERIASVLDKGSNVVVTGSQETEAWKPQGSADMRYTTKYRVTSWELMMRTPPSGRVEQHGQQRRPTQPPTRYAARPVGGPQRPADGTAGSESEQWPQVERDSAGTERYPADDDYLKM